MAIQIPLPPGLPQRPELAFAALAKARGAFWLDSGAAPSAHGRYHFLGARPTRRWTLQDADPFVALGEALDFGDALPLPAARLVATIAYDLGCFADRVAVATAPEVGPDATLSRYDACATYDLVTGEAWLSATSASALQSLVADLRATPSTPSTPLTPSVTVDHSEASYAQLVATVLEAIGRGEVYQVNLSQRFLATFAAPPDAPALYQRLRRRSAPYGCYLDLGETQVLSNSPEAFLHVDLRDGVRRVTTFPLKGTRPAGSDPTELRDSAKDRAEHVMIVDLERNDLGRIAVPGTVRVPRLFDVVSHPTVLHLESEVTAEVRPDVHLPDVLRALFPGGSITGAPKLAATALIARLEGRRRGLYCGAIGMVDFDGLRSTWSIPIRTGILQGRGLAFRSGGGIVADSTPDGEWRETWVKARAFLELCGLKG